MKKAVRTLLGAVCVAVALTGCGSPGSDTAFKGPNGWKSTPGMFGRFQMWIAGANQNDRQIVMLVRGDQNMNVEDSQTYSGTRSMHDLSRKSITLCGTQQAEYFTGSGESGNGSTQRKQTIEGVTTSIGNSKYAALYIRPAGTQPDAQAESSLHSLCPLK